MSPYYKGELYPDYDSYFRAMYYDPENTDPEGALALARRNGYDPSQPIADVSSGGSQTMAPNESWDTGGSQGDFDYYSKYAPPPVVPAPAPVIEPPAVVGPPAPSKYLTGNYNPLDDYLTWVKNGKPMNFGRPDGIDRWTKESVAQYQVTLGMASREDKEMVTMAQNELTSAQRGWESSMAYQDRLQKLENLVGQMVKDGSGGGYRQAGQRLYLGGLSSDQARVEAVLREGLNSGEIQPDPKQIMTSGVINWISERVGLSPDETANWLSSTLSAGASALTMIMTKGNFPLGAAAYFGSQGALKGLMGASVPQTYGSSNGGKRELFKGIFGQGFLDGASLLPYDVALPLGLPHDIFGEARFIVYDHLTGRWIPADELQPVQYWSNEPYRYTALDRISSKVYHANVIKPSRIYV